MSVDSLVLVVNPGSASRKYALFSDGQIKANIHFEFENNKVVGSIEYDGDKHSTTYNESDFNTVARYVLPLLKEHRIINDEDKISAIGIRLVAPSNSFLKDVLISDEIIKVLEEIGQKAPLHISIVLSEIIQLRGFFADIPIVAVSDSAFHITKPGWAWNYGIDTEMSDRLGIKRFGYHGISVESVVRKLKDHEVLAPKMIICHLGSGSSITAVKDGKSVDNSMGYTPLEGLMMATRSGTMDVSAALAIKRELQLTDDGLEQYLNKQSGLLGVSGSSNDIRQLLEKESQGDERARLALELFVRRIQQMIGQMAAVIGGVDGIVFTGTVGARSNIIRARILENLNHLGFTCNKDLNEKVFEPADLTNISYAVSNPIWVVSTDESLEIARRTELYIKK